jgi:hypothetical protein
MSEYPSTLVSVPDLDQLDDFWAQVALPHQTEDASFEFTNDVVTAEWFAQKTASIAHLSGLAELLQEEIANLYVYLRREEYALYRFRVKLLSEHYDKLTKSADKEVRDSFIRRMASETGRLAVLEAHEDTINDLRRRIEVREPRRDEFYARLKALQLSQESARQYLDHAKLEKRLLAATQGQRV